MTLKSEVVGLSACSDDLIKHTKSVFFRQKSNYNFIFGRRGKGKTDFSLLLSEIIKSLRPKTLVATNIKIFKAPFKIESITDLQTLRSWCEAYKGVPKLVIIDELGKVAKRRRFMSAINIKLIEDLQVLRKYNLNIIYITQTEKVVDSTLIDMDYLDGFYDKYALDYLEYTDIYGTHHLDHAFNGLPRTIIEFDSSDVARFTEYPQENEEEKKFFGVYEDLARKWYIRKTHKEGPKLNVVERNTVSRLAYSLLLEKCKNAFGTDV